MESSFLNCLNNNSNLNSNNQTKFGQFLVVEKESSNENFSQNSDRDKPVKNMN